MGSLPPETRNGHGLDLHDLPQPGPGSLRRRDPAETHADPYALGVEPCTDSDPLDALEGLEAHGMMAKAFQRLTQVERQLLSMAFFRGLTHEQIARCTQAPLGSVKTVIRNAMQKLKRSLETQADFADLKK
jgi:RNA polymerase sigma-70 factor, ECF subfamily